MHDNPATDWQSLTEHYRSMYDEELKLLATDFDDLTPTAQEALRSELSIRRLPAPGVARVTTESDSQPTQRWGSGVDPDAAGNRSDNADESDEYDRPTEFTWKTQLCECETGEQAWQLHEVLKRAGIDSWVETASARLGGYLRIMVAADQLEQATAIASQPIPQDIIEQTTIEVPEFVPPKCPSCGAEDPVLESAEPTNSWLCAACGKQWNEPATEATDQT